MCACAVESKSLRRNNFWWTIALWLLIYRRTNIYLYGNASDIFGHHALVQARGWERAYFRAVLRHPPFFFNLFCVTKKHLSINSRVCLWKRVLTLFGMLAIVLFSRRFKCCVSWAIVPRWVYGMCYCLCARLLILSTVTVASRVTSNSAWS